MKNSLEKEAFDLQKNLAKNRISRLIKCISHNKYHSEVSLESDSGDPNEMDMKQLYKLYIDINKKYIK